MLKKPKVSIIIPVFNGSNYLKEAINSALAQTYKNIEVIVINDGSNDNDATDKIALSYGNKIRYYKKVNGGVSSALNFGIKKMDGEFFSWLSHDDIFLPDKIEKELNLSLKNNNCIIACNIDIVDHNLNLIKHNFLPARIDLTFLGLNLKCGLNGCSLLIHKKMFDKYGFFNENLKFTQDYDMWSRFLKKENIIVLNDHLVLSRQHPNQDSKRKQNIYIEVDLLHSKIIDEISEEDFREYFKNDTKLMIDTFNEFYLYMKCLKSAIKLLEKAFSSYYNIESINNKIFQNLFFVFPENNLIKIKKRIDNKKKVLLFYNTVWIKGGIETVLSTLFKVLIKDYNIILITSNFHENLGPTIPKEIITIDLINITEILPVTILFLSKILMVDIFIGSQNLDINVLNTYQMLKDFNIKTIISNNYSYFLPIELPWLSKVIQNRFETYNNVSAILWTNEESAKISRGAFENTYYIPNPNKYSQIEFSKIKKFGKQIICIGRFNDLIKRFDLTLKCFKKILEKDSDAILTVIGKVDKNLFFPFDTNMTINELLYNLHIPEKNIRFIGEVDDVSSFLKNSDLLILTSVSEGFGMVVTEAACFGVPSIAFNILGITTIIKNGINGYIVEMNEIDSMANVIVQYINNKNIQIEMKKRALEMSHFFDSEKIVKEWEALLKMILSDKFKSNVTDKPNSWYIIKKYEEAIVTNNTVIWHTNINEEYENNHLKTDKKRGTRLKEIIYQKINYYYNKNGLKKTIFWLIKKPFVIVCKQIKKIVS